MIMPAQVRVHEFATKLIESVDSNPRGVDIVRVVSSQSTYNDAILETITDMFFCKQQTLSKTLD
jgi:hypothetical protein